MIIGQPAKRRWRWPRLKLSEVPDEATIRNLLIRFNSKNTTVLMHYDAMNQHAPRNMLFRLFQIHQ